MTCRAIPYEGSEPYVFLSYCHMDKERLYPLFEQIAVDGYRTWYDDGNHAGDDWLDNIEDHLEGCSVCIAFISGNSSLSHNCKSEIVYALKCKKKIIPVLIDSSDLPKGLRMQLSHLHYLKSSDYASDKALLAKIYESEGCSECKAPAGSLHLKPDSQTGNTSGSSSQEHVSVSGAKQSTENTAGKVRKIKVSLFSQKRRESNSSSEPEQSASSATETDNHSSSQPQNILQHSVMPEQDDDGKTVISKADNPYNEPTVREVEDGDVTVRISNRSLGLLIHPASAKAYILRKPQTKIGRSPIKCDVVIEGNDSISKYHADIIQYNQKFFLRDADSSNGTFLNGEQLESGNQVQLENPSVFQLNDETLILVSGSQARGLVSQNSGALLMNEGNNAIRFMDSDTLPLNRNHQWPDGTLSDPKIHRAAHAMLCKKEDGIYLVDETPEGGNCTYLNGARLKHGEARALTNGDNIRLGDTTLQFVSFTI